MSPTQWLMLVAAIIVLLGIFFWQFKRVPDIAGRLKAWECEAEMEAHRHLMEAEHHQALADMYVARAKRLACGSDDLCKDAARYRWLREHATLSLDQPVWIVTDHGQRVHVSSFCRHETDRAIDAAMAGADAS